MAMPVSATNRFARGEISAKTFFFISEAIENTSAEKVLLNYFLNHAMLSFLRTAVLSSCNIW